MTAASERVATPSDRFVAVEGGQLFVRRWRAPECAAGAAPLLLLHDSLGSVALWRHFPASLALTLRREVIAYDRLGFGRSSVRHARPGADFIEHEARCVLPALADALGLERYALLGHSVGGGMALVAAALHPARCERVVSIAAQAFVEPRTRAAVRAARARYAMPGPMQRLSRWHGDRAAWVVDAWTGTWLARDFAGWCLDPWLPRIACPVLALHGDRDEFGSVAFPLRIVARAGGDARMLLLRDCGHVPHRERAAATLAAIAAFADVAPRWFRPEPASPPARPGRTRAGSARSRPHRRWPWPGCPTASPRGGRRPR